MRILLDENFPLALLRSLLSDGEKAEHIITLGWRGVSDARIRERLSDPEVLFLTQDDDFLFSEPTRAVIVISRVRQARRIVERVDSGCRERRRAARDRTRRGRASAGARQSPGMGCRSQ